MMIISAKTSPEIVERGAHHIYHRHINAHKQLHRNAYGLMDHIDRRQKSANTATAPAASAAPQQNSATITYPSAWEVQTSQACTSALSVSNGQVSNPSGMAVCYNVLSLDTSIGSFEAELRIYNVSAPIDLWVGVTTQDMSVVFSYAGASVQHMNQAFVKRHVFLSESHIEERGGRRLVRRGTETPQQLKASSYVGQINSGLMGLRMNM